MYYQLPQIVNTRKNCEKKILKMTTRKKKIIRGEIVLAFETKTDFFLNDFDPKHDTNIRPITIDK